MDPVNVVLVESIREDFWYRGTIGTDIAGVVVVVQLTAVYAESPDERLNVTTLLKHLPPLQLCS